MSSWRKGVLAFLRWVDLSSGGHIAKAVGRCADTPGIPPPPVFGGTLSLATRVYFYSIYFGGSFLFSGSSSVPRVRSRISFSREEDIGFDCRKTHTWMYLG